jgi:hypothetical protein
MNCARLSLGSTKQSRDRKGAGLWHANDIEFDPGESPAC